MSFSSCQRHFRGDGSQTVRRTMSGGRQIRSCGLVVHVFLGLVCRLYLRMSFLEKAFFLIVVSRVLLRYFVSHGLCNYFAVTSGVSVVSCVMSAVRSFAFDSVVLIWSYLLVLYLFCTFLFVLLPCVRATRAVEGHCRVSEALFCFFVFRVLDISCLAMCLAP